MHEKWTRNGLRFAGRKCTAQHTSISHNALWMQPHNAVVQDSTLWIQHSVFYSHDERYSDMNGLIFSYAVDEVKALILESVNAWKNYKKRVPSRCSQGARAPRSAHTTLSEGVATLGT